MIRILFVDDEPNVLSGLRRLLFPMRKQWKTAFAESGEKALEILAKEEFDVIVSDMRMPGMDGMRLLNEVRERHPQLVRIILTGQTDDSQLADSMLTAHQFLSKPCGLNTIVETIEHAVQTGALIHDESLKRIIAKVKTLPSLPEVYNRIVGELESKEPSLNRVGKIIGSDLAMSAKILNLANSPFFGFSSKIKTPDQAATLLGINTIRTLVLGLHVFSVFDSSKVSGFSLEKLWEHSLRTATLCRAIAKHEGFDKDAMDACAMSGLLHDVGKLVLVAHLPELYADVLDEVRDKNKTVLEVERARLGVSHAEVGAYLLGLWGMPQEALMAVMRHHEPTAIGRQVRPVMILHLADILDHELFVANPHYAKPAFDASRAKALGHMDRIDQWKVLALEIMQNAASAKGRSK